MSKQLEFITHVENNNVEKVKEMLSKVDPKADNSEALNSACIAGNLEMVKVLLPWSDPSANGGRAMKNAAFYGHTEVALLVAEKVDVGVVGEAMCVAAASDNLETLKAIKTNKASDMDDALIWACVGRAGPETLRYLNRNANPAAYDGSAMIHAITSNNTDAIDLFVGRVEPEVVMRRVENDNIQGEGLEYYKEKLKCFESVLQGDVGQKLKERMNKNEVMSRPGVKFTG